MKRLTPKQLVLKRWPKAYAWKWSGLRPWVVYTGERSNQMLTQSDATPQQAWASAAKRPSVKDCFAASKRRKG